MGLNDVPSGERVHIGIFGKRNAGKSSLINAVTNQNIAIVSDVMGTTTDPVSKAMELLPLGPVMVTDTPGIDDTGELGSLRVIKSYQVLNKTDIAVIVVDGAHMSSEDKELAEKIKEKNIPYAVVYNKCDGFAHSMENAAENEIYVSAKSGENINELRELIARLAQIDDENARIVGDILKPDDFVVLVVPIDKAAPKGRLILPQQQTIRDILDTGAISIVTRETELENTLKNAGKKPALVITDSQAFGRVSAETPDSIPLTSFSILMARHKGVLAQTVSGVTAVDRLCDGDTILISEGCTHHRQCGDIGTVKMPNWISEYTHKKLEFDFSSGTEFPENLGKYKLVVHCGGCMLNEREMRYRMRVAGEQGIPMTNYGILIAYIHGILKRSVAPFPDIAKLL